MVHDKMATLKAVVALATAQLFMPMPLGHPIYILKNITY